VKLLSPKINPIIAHQNCVAPRSSIGTSAEDSGAQRIRIRISPTGVESHKLKFIDDWIVLKDSGCLICMLF
jgi:hypothetical protein